VPGTRWCAPVADKRWDVVVDVTRQPVQAKGAVAALAGGTNLFVCVSSGNVYADHSEVGQDESGALLEALEGDVMESMEVYGQAKVACERHVMRVRAGPSVDPPRRAHRRPG
jgi:nucleoside-diphosphate-sugar epimerase